MCQHRCCVLLQYGVLSSIPFLILRKKKQKWYSGYNIWNDKNLSKFSSQGILRKQYITNRILACVEMGTWGVLIRPPCLCTILIEQHGDPDQASPPLKQHNRSLETQNMLLIQVFFLSKPFSDLIYMKSTLHWADKRNISFHTLSVIVMMIFCYMTPRVHSQFWVNCIFNDLFMYCPSSVIPQIGLRTLDCIKATELSFGIIKELNTVIFFTYLPKINSF